MKSITEQANPRTIDIDRKSSLDIVRLINDEDKLVAGAVERALPEIARAVDLIVDCLEAEGSLVYVGTGTSGRLGVLDASECPPTFGVSPDLVKGIIAGGYDALQRSIEGAEDDADQGARDMKAFNVSDSDVVVGLSANGNTAYTVGAVKAARE